MTGSATLPTKELKLLCMSALKTILEIRNKMVHDKIVDFLEKYNQDIETQNQNLIRKLLCLKPKRKIDFQEACDIMDQKYKELKSSWSYYDDAYLRKSKYKVGFEKTLNRLLSIADERQEDSVSIDLETLGDICRLNEGIEI